MSHSPFLPHFRFLDQDETTSTQLILITQRVCGQAVKEMRESAKPKNEELKPSNDRVMYWNELLSGSWD